MNTAHREIDEFPALKRPVIIATKGLPCTGKSEIANLLGKWARCTVLYIDDFLDAVSCVKGYHNSRHSPSPDEADHLRRLAFSGLCTVALRHLRLGEKCIVIKSRLCSSFELNDLVLVVKASTVRCRVVVIEFQVKNEHRFRLRLDDKVTWYGHEEFWYKPRSWKDIEKAKDCSLDAQAWDLSIVDLINSLSEEGLDFPWVVTRLVLDAFDDLNLTPDSHPLSTELSPSFVDVFKYLLIGYEREEGLNEDQYVVMKFNELRRCLLEKELRASASKERSKYLCTASSRGCCVFKYREYSHDRDADDQEEGNPYRCRVCEERVFSCQSAYTCHFCILTLHQFLPRVPLLRGSSAVCLAFT